MNINFIDFNNLYYILTVNYMCLPIKVTEIPYINHKKNIFKPIWPKRHTTEDDISREICAVSINPTGSILCICEVLGDKTERKQRICFRNA